MLFNSIEFAIFFPVVTALYFLVAHRFRWMLLLVASCVFYMAYVPKFILVLFFLIGVDYAAGLAIEASEGARRKAWLVASLVVNVGTLAVFKYFNFINDNLAALARALHLGYPMRQLALGLPIGLSFHTFQSMAYTIDVYRRRQRAERHLGIYALYVLFYPQMVAGPIERPQHLIPQLREPKSFDWSRVAEGLKLMAGGFFKKMVIADRLAVVVGAVYAHPRAHAGPALWLATYFFAFQILCDFSGYTDIARGAAHVMGFSLVENFRRPYFAASVSEFWRRWHISLSTWLRDYLYIPLGGNRVGTARRCFNLFVVFLIGGLWHGPRWTYVAWGALHGAYLAAGVVFEAVAGKAGARMRGSSLPGAAPVRVLVTFHLIVFALVFFRAADLADARYIVGHLVSGFGGFGELARGLAIPGVDAVDLVTGAGLIALLIAAQLLQRERSIWQRLAGQAVWVRWSAYYAFSAALFTLAVLAQPGPPQPFFYFQF